MLEEFIIENILWQIFLRLPPGRQKQRSLRAPRVPFPVGDPTNQRSAYACQPIRDRGAGPIHSDPRAL